MRHAAVKERVCAGGVLIHMGVEGVAGEGGEMFNVGQRDLAPRGHNLVAKP